MCPEQRKTRTFYKLRFRRAGKQVVRYLGNAETAAAVNNELLALQAEHKMLRELQSLVAFAHRELRVGKKQLEPLLQAAGWAFHGLAVRRTRNR